MLRVIAGDLTRYEAQVAVTCASNRLAGREGLDAKMHDAAGEKLRETCVEIGKYSVLRICNLVPWELLCLPLPSICLKNT